MVINRRRIRRSMGTRVVRRQGTKRGTRLNARPKTRMKNIIRDLKAGLIEHP